MRYYESFERFSTGFKMGFKMFMVIVLTVILIQFVFVYAKVAPLWNELTGLTVPVSNAKIPKQVVRGYFFDMSLGFVKDMPIPQEFIPYFRKKDALKLFPKNRIPRSKFNRLLDFTYDNKFAQFKPRAIYYFKNSFFFQILSLVAFLLFLRSSFKQHEDKHIRGTKLIGLKAMKNKLKKMTSDETDNLEIAGLRIPRAIEVSHTLILGTTGTGKSVLINQFINGILRRKISRKSHEKLIVYDVKGEFLGKWFHSGSEKRPSDILFFPFDARSIRYSIFNEIKSDIDYKIIAQAFFPHVEGSKNDDSFFDEAAGEVFKTGLIYLNWKGRKLNRDILEFFSQLREKLINDFKEMPLNFHGAISYIEDSRQGSSVLSSLIRRINFLEYLSDMDGDFSFRDYIQNENDKRNLFIPNNANFKMIFRPLLTFVVDIMIREVLSLKDDRNRRVFFILDEFGSLAKLESIFNFLKESRSKGGALVVASQDLGDVAALYGHDLKSTFFNNFNSNFIFRLIDPVTAKFLSDAIGEREVHKKMESISMSPKDVGDRKSISTQDKKEAVLLPSEFQELDNFNAVVKISNVGISKIIVPQIFYENKVEPFVKGEFKYKIEQQNSKI
jgi:type IV secretory pathway TraG/TraD family ATPase VirD4